MDIIAMQPQRHGAYTFYSWAPHAPESPQDRRTGLGGIGGGECLWGDLGAWNKETGWLTIMDLNVSGDGSCLTENAASHGCRLRSC